jgi:lambda family phage minor tail protein L
VISSDVQRLNTGSLLEMFELDATAIGGELFRWHSGVNPLGGTLIWNGNAYPHFPVDATGFARTSSGTIPRPTIRVTNISGLISLMAKSFNDLCGAKVTRIRTFSKYIDAINFPGGVNPQADPNCAFAPEIWYVDRKANENGLYVEFELSAAFDVRGVKLPRRQCIQNTCSWAYRSAECGYAGGPVATTTDAPTSSPSSDVCGKRISSCKLRFGVDSPLNFGGMPGVGLVQ